MTLHVVRLNTGRLHASRRGAMGKYVLLTVIFDNGQAKIVFSFGLGLAITEFDAGLASVGVVFVVCRAAFRVLVRAEWIALENLFHEGLQNWDGASDDKSASLDSVKL